MLELKCTDIKKNSAWKKMQFTIAFSCYTTKQWQHMESHGKTINYNCYLVICDSATVKSSTWSNLEKNKTCHFCLWCLLSGNERAKTSNSIVDHFSFTSVNLLLAWMLYFHVWLQDTDKFLVLREYYN